MVEDSWLIACILWGEYCISRGFDRVWITNEMDRVYLSSETVTVGAI